MPIEHLDLDHIVASTSFTDGPKRRRLADVSTLIAKAKRVVVVSGAGISCSSGIPDFRSETGLYSLVKKRYPDTFVTGKDLFSSGLFNNPNTTSVFLTFIAELSLACLAAQPTQTHHFIQKLDKTGKLLRSYTQNVDGFERRMGMESGGRGKGLSKANSRNVELHGDLGRVRCVLCFADFPAHSHWVEEYREGNMPDCPACEERCNQRVKRGSRALAVGSLRPAIVLYDEPHPLGDAIGDLQSHDLKRGPDVLLIMGTSLKVHGLKQLVKSFAKRIHDHENPKKRGIVVFVNQTKPGKEWEGIIDVHVQGETDKWVEQVEEVWRKVKSADWETQTKLEGQVVGGVVAEEVKALKGKLGPKKGKAGKKETHPFFQLPTPRATRSPSAGLGDSRGSSPLTPTTSELPTSIDFTGTIPHTGLNTPPISPSKRGAGTPIISDSPAKKPRPPQTGTMPTPGGGNLFASPKKAALGEDMDYEGNAGRDDKWEDEVFVSTMLGKQGKGKIGVKGRGVQQKVSLTMPTRTSVGDKENTPVKTVVGLTAAGKAGTKKMVEVAIGTGVGGVKKRGLRSAPVRGG